MATKLVIGGSGFLGSNVARQLVSDGHQVRMMLRRTSSTRAIDDLDVERCYGDVFDTDAIREAMTGVDDVYYCVVDARPWLRDPAPLIRTNVEGLRTVLDVAAGADLNRFVFTSSIGTLAVSADQLVNEEDEHNWADRSGTYIASRVAAENLLLEYSRDGRVPGVAMCVANTYGAGDFLPTPHGQFVAMAARGKLPVFIRGAASEVVAVDEAARALVLAARKGRVGERYIISERWMSAEEIVKVAADAVGAAAPKRGVPLAVIKAAGAAGSVASRLGRRDLRVTATTMRLMHVMTPLDHSKAVAELGWNPRPTPDAIREAARFFTRGRDQVVRPSSTTP